MNQFLASDCHSQWRTQLRSFRNLYYQWRGGCAWPWRGNWSRALQYLLHSWPFAFSTLWKFHHINKSQFIYSTDYRVGLLPLWGTVLWWKCFSKHFCICLLVNEWESVSRIYMSKWHYRELEYVYNCLHVIMSICVLKWLYIL